MEWRYNFLSPVYSLGGIVLFHSGRGLLCLCRRSEWGWGWCRGVDIRIDRTLVGDSTLQGWVRLWRDEVARG